MFYTITNNQITKEQTLPANKNEISGKGLYFYYGSFEALEPLTQLFSFCAKNAYEISAGKIEVQEDIIYISAVLPREINDAKNSCRFFIVLHKDFLIILCNEAQQMDTLFTEEDLLSFKEPTLPKILYLFFERLINNDNKILEDIEQEILELEENLITQKSSNCIKDIILLRRKLLNIKRYYEQLLDITDEIQEDENHFLDNRSTHLFKMFSKRLDRLYHNVTNLRDNVTQLREAYQSQVDINLNSIMKIFTVITAVFLPLTLIAGWYGMNLNMPEYQWTHGYLFVIGISIICLLLSIFFFWKKHWF